MRVGALVLSAVAFLSPFAQAQPQPEKVEARDPKLEAHLKGWKDSLDTITNYRVEVALKRTDLAPSGRTEFELKGELLGMKPNLFRFRIPNRSNRGEAVPGFPG